MRCAPLCACERSLGWCPHAREAECASRKNSHQPMQVTRRKRCQTRTRPRKKGCVYCAGVSGATIYSYVDGNPLSRVDLRGLQAFIPGPGGIPLPVIPLPGRPNMSQVPGWDPADGPPPAPGTGTIIWPPGFSPNPEPTTCRIEVPSSPPPPPPKNDCESQLKVCTDIARSYPFVTKAAVMAACFVQYAICKKVFN